MATPAADDKCLTRVREEEAIDRPLLERGWRYVLVGLLCAVANNIIMIAVDYARGHYLLGVFLAFALVTPAAYVLHSYFTFGALLNFRAFLRFTGSVMAAYPITVFMMVLLCSGLRLPVVTAAPVTTVALFAWNFVAAHWAILPRLRFASAFSTRRNCPSMPEGLD